MLTLYGLGCPNCHRLEAILNQSELEYRKNTNQQDLMDLAAVSGKYQQPLLVFQADSEGDKQVFNFNEAVRFIQEVVHAK